VLRVSGVTDPVRRLRVACSGLTDKFTIHKGDFMRQTLPPFDLCVANIPFQVCAHGHGCACDHSPSTLRFRCWCAQISSPVVRTLVTHRPLIKRGVIMFQAEFADRLTAKCVCYELACRRTASLTCDCLRLYSSHKARHEGLLEVVRQHAVGG